MKIVALGLIALLAVPPGILAQGPAPAPPAPAGGVSAQGFQPQELEQLLAPIALYPDALLAQILMASTYPLEVVQADRWVKANPNVQGAQLEAAMEQQPWDPSVKSLTAVPQVLSMMSDKLEWTQKLGDAFLAQQKDVLDTAQRLRAKAQAAGNLKTTSEQKVIVEEQVIRLESPDPQVVYVPTYNPAVIYGPWPYPAYPPYAYYPPGYAAGAALLSFGAGVAVGWALWGNCNWHGGNVYVNVNRYNTYNKTNIHNADWQHNGQHRQGVPYRDRATAQQFGRGTRPGADAREAFRGRAEQGRQQLGQSGFDRGAGGAGKDRQALGHEGGTGGRQGLSGGREAGAFQGLGHGGDVQASSQRGSQSRAGMVGAHPGGGRMGGGGAGRRR